jgi:hypothetical protein
VPRHPPYALSNLTKKSLSIQIDLPVPICLLKAGNHRGRLCIDKLVIYGKNTYLLKELILSSRLFSKIGNFEHSLNFVELSGIEPLTFPTLRRDALPQACGLHRFSAVLSYIPILNKEHLILSGAKRDRTANLQNANLALSQLSYSP